MKLRGVIIGVVGAVTLCNEGVFSQRIDVLITPQASLTRIGVDALASGGSSVAEEGLASAAFTNPACMNVTGLTFYGEVGKYEKSGWSAGFQYNGQTVAPACVSLGMPIDRFSVALSYARQYSNRITSPPIAFTTEENPDGTGQTTAFESTFELHTLFGSLRWACSDSVSLGLSLGVNMFTERTGSFLYSLKGSGYGLFLAGGVHIELDESVSLGFAGRYNARMSFTPEAATSPLGSLPEGNFYQVDAHSVDVRFPPIVEAGVSVRATAWLLLLASVEFQNWTTALPDGENLWQIHLGGVTNIGDQFAVRFGYFTLSSPYVASQEVFDQQFITVGFQVQAGPLQVSVAMMDSHLFSKDKPTRDLFGYSEQFYQTYYTAGVSVAF
jgi:hypothetical protein